MVAHRRSKLQILDTALIQIMMTRPKSSNTDLLQGAGKGRHEVEPTWETQRHVFECFKAAMTAVDVDCLRVPSNAAKRPRNASALSRLEAITVQFEC